MALPFQFPLGTSGVMVAAACVVAGGPWFADGYRALRLRRQLSRLRVRRLAEDALGFVQVRGQVKLAGPMFTPLSAQPCAGFQLEVCGVDWPVHGVVSERRAFDLEGDGTEARVHAEAGDWRMPVTHERTFAADEPMSENLARLLSHDGDLATLTQRRGAVRIVERALLPGSEISVIGIATHDIVRQGEAVLELARTGTDGDTLLEYMVQGAGTSTREIGPAESLAVQVIADGPVEASRLAPQRRRVLGTLFGPALALAGLLYLARAASSTLAGRF